MTFRIVLVLAAGLSLAACEKEKGVGFTGIGPSATQNATSAYALDFDGLVPFAKSTASKPAIHATR